MSPSSPTTTGNAAAVLVEEARASSVVVVEDDADHAGVADGLRGARRSATRSSCSWRHGAHHVAKKLTSTQLAPLVGEVERRRRRAVGAGERRGRPADQRAVDDAVGGRLAGGEHDHEQADDDHRRCDDGDRHERRPSARRPRRRSSARRRSTASASRAAPTRLAALAGAARRRGDGAGHGVERVARRRPGNGGEERADEHERRRRSRATRPAAGRSPASADDAGVEVGAGQRGRGTRPR